MLISHTCRCGCKDVYIRIIIVEANKSTVQYNTVQRVRIRLCTPILALQSLCSLASPNALLTEYFFLQTVTIQSAPHVPTIVVTQLACRAIHATGLWESGYGSAVARMRLIWYTQQHCIKLCARSWHGKQILLNITNSRF